MSKRSVGDSLRRTVVARDGEACRYCGAILVLPWQRVTIDHKIPRCRGGNNDLENLVVACSRCNSLKSTKTPKEMGWTIFPPRFFDDQIHRAREYLISIGYPADIIPCGQCGDPFDSFTEYGGNERSVVRRWFCSKNHAVDWTRDRTAEKEERRLHEPEAAPRVNPYVNKENDSGITEVQSEHCRPEIVRSVEADLSTDPVWAPEAAPVPLSGRTIGYVGDAP